MARYLISEECHGNWAGRIDTAVIMDMNVPVEKVRDWEKTFGTSAFRGWQDNPRIVHVFAIDPCDEDMGYDIEEYEQWLKAHDGEYSFDCGEEDDEVAAC